LISDTELPEPVMSVESVWKMNTDLGSPCPSRVTVPVSPNGDLLVPAYTPPTSVTPDRSPGAVSVSFRPAAAR
jgi:hypothetical protein